MSNDVHSLILEEFFFSSIDRNVPVAETPLFLGTYDGEPLSEVLARQFWLSPEEAAAAIEAAQQEVAL